jgi:hypothetical protein
MSTHPIQFLAAALLCLAIAVPVAAQDGAGNPEEPAPEDAAWQAADSEAIDHGESFDGTDPDPAADASSTQGDAIPDMAADIANAEEDDRSDRKRLKRKLKGLLVGLLLPAVEKRVRKAIGQEGTADEAGDASVDEADAGTEEQP